ncbi:CopG family transcriptional regulator [bacterium]|nr:CopG family transcriptional regulator [bacterium]
MKILIDIPDLQIKQLKRYCKEKNLSRSEVIRTAIQEFLPKVYSTLRNHPAVGLWTDHKEDSVKYQRRLRNEWRS